MALNEMAILHGKPLRGPSEPSFSPHRFIAVPWHSLKPGSTFCDIGSGVGGVALAIAKAHGLKVTLHDKALVLEGAKKVIIINFYPTLS